MERFPGNASIVDDSIIIYSLNTMYCKSLWKKTSTKCINVNLFLMKTHISDRVQVPGKYKFYAYAFLKPVDKTAAV